MTFSCCHVVLCWIVLCVLGFIELSKISSFLSSYPKSVRNCCVIERFGGVLVVALLIRTLLLV